MLGRLHTKIACTCACRSIRAAMSTASVASPATDVQCTVTPEGLGRITLCRDRQLNALGAVHVEQLNQQLLAWADPSSGVKAVLLDSNNDRSFCSGGDVKAVRQAVLDQPYSNYPPPDHHIHTVFQAEYSTLLLTASYTLPLVSCCQGIWMGLGFGIAGFGKYRVVSDGTTFAMPENSIGLWPDVGFAYKAAHMPGFLGLFLGLTGVRVTSPADLLYCGIATHYIPAEQLQVFKQKLGDNPTAVASVLEQYSQPASDAPGPLQRLQPVIDRQLEQLVQSWKQGTDEQTHILQQLAEGLRQERHAIHNKDHQAALLLQNAINGLQYGSPRSLAVTLQHFTQVQEAVMGAKVNLGSSLDLSTLSGVMHMEYRMAVRQVAHEDFLEGVRASLVDKDRRPRWLAAATTDSHSADAGSRLPGNRFPVQHLFQSLPGDLALDWHLLA